MGVAGKTEVLSQELSRKFLKNDFWGQFDGGPGGN